MTMIFFWSKFAFGKCFGSSSLSNHWTGYQWLSYEIHFSLHITIQLRNSSLLLHTIKEDDISKWLFLICSQLMRHLLIDLFHLSNLLQMLNDHRLVNIEFFKFSFSCKRISFNDHLNWSLPTFNGWPLDSLFSRFLSPLQNFLNH